MLKECIWKGRRVSCSAIFTMHPTDQGMCCSFNKPMADEMFLRSRYMEEMLIRTYQDKNMSQEDSALPEWYDFTKGSPAPTILLQFQQCIKRFEMHYFQVWPITCIRTYSGSHPHTWFPQWSCYCFIHNGLLSGMGIKLSFDWWGNSWYNLSCVKITGIPSHHW